MAAPSAFMLCLLGGVLTFQCLGYFRSKHKDAEIFEKSSKPCHVGIHWIALWWMLADKCQNYMKRCELMVKLLCHASRLKADDSKLLRASFFSRSCTLCDHASYENVLHMVMQCPHHYNSRIEMYTAIAENGRALDNVCTFDILMGGVIDGWDLEGMLPIWKISCTYISRMYYNVINSRIN